VVSSRNTSKLIESAFYTRTPNVFSSPFTKKVH
jgi:hypothetical protein